MKDSAGQPKIDSVSESLRNAMVVLCARLMVHFRQKGGVVLITSAAASEGKSTVAANIGLSMASVGRHALLVDADFGRPVLHHLLGCSNSAGFRTLLRSQGGEGEMVQKISPGLSFLCAGPAGADAEVLVQSSGLVAAMAESWRKRYDLVIFDAPAMQSGPEAELLAPCCDGVLMVVGAGISSAREVAAARKRLEAAGGAVLGSVLNRVTGGRMIYGAGRAASTQALDSITARPGPFLGLPAPGVPER